MRKPCSPLYRHACAYACVCVCVCVWCVRAFVRAWVGGWVRGCMGACVRVRVCARARMCTLPVPLCPCARVRAHARVRVHLRARGCVVRVCRVCVCVCVCVCGCVWVRAFACICVRSRACACAPGARCVHVRGCVLACLCVIAARRGEGSAVDAVRFGNEAAFKQERTFKALRLQLHKIHVVGVTSFRFRASSVQNHQVPFTVLCGDPRVQEGCCYSERAELQSMKMLTSRGEGKNGWPHIKAWKPSLNAPPCNDASYIWQSRILPKSPKVSGCESWPFFLKGCCFPAHSFPRMWSPVVHDASRRCAAFAHV